jgi:thiamine transporter
MVALATVLGFIRLFRMPQGGSISLEMVPIFIIALRRGGPVGLLAGGIYGLLQLLIDPYIVHPVQVLLEYPLAFALVGLAGFFKEKPWLGITVGSAARYIVHVISGMIFFGSYAPEGTPVLIYSLGYNAIYILPNLIISGLIVGLLAPVVKYGLKR